MKLTLKHIGSKFNSCISYGIQHCFKYHLLLIKLKQLVGGLHVIIINIFWQNSLHNLILEASIFSIFPIKYQWFKINRSFYSACKDLDKQVWMFQCFWVKKKHDNVLRRQYIISCSSTVNVYKTYFRYF